jgi:hypothetical protein
LAIIPGLFLERRLGMLDQEAAELGELVEEQDTVVPEGSQMYLDGLG